MFCSFLSQVSFPLSVTPAATTTNNAHISLFIIALLIEFLPAILHFGLAWCCEKSAEDMKRGRKIFDRGKKTKFSGVIFANLSKNYLLIRSQNI